MSATDPVGRALEASEEFVELGEQIAVHTEIFDNALAACRYSGAAAALRELSRLYALAADATERVIAGANKPQ